MVAEPQEETQRAGICGFLLMDKKIELSCSFLTSLSKVMRPTLQRLIILNTNSKLTAEENSPETMTEFSVWPTQCLREPFVNLHDLDIMATRPREKRAMIQWQRCLCACTAGFGVSRRVGCPPLPPRSYSCKIHTQFRSHPPELQCYL